MIESQKVQAPIDTSKDITNVIPLMKEGAKDTKFQRIELKEYEVLKPEQHTFINTMLQLSNQILGLRQQYQQHVAAIDDLMNTIKELKANRNEEILIPKGGMFFVKRKATKVFIANLQKKRQEIINANNMTVGQLQKNYALYIEYRNKVALVMANYLEDKKARKLVDEAQRIDDEIADLLKGKV